MAEIKSVVKRTGAVVPFTPERITNAIYRAAVAVGGRDRATAEQLTRQVIDLLERTLPPDHTPTVEEIQDTVEKVLIENGHARVAKAYILYRDERARMRRERASRAARPSENIPWAKIWQVLDWAVTHSLHTVEAMNTRIQAGEFAQIVKEAEAAYNEDIENAVEMIAERQQDVRMVIVAGPSSSGKTTTTFKIAQRLEPLKLKLVTLNVDNYFFDLAMHPKDEFGDYDFETPQALDLKLINQHLKQLVAGEQALIPVYDFKTGTRVPQQTPLQLAPGEVLLIDSLHGLYPEMTAGISLEQQFRLYLEPLLQMKDAQGNYVRWTDLRLIRRMLRDAVHRAYDPTRTLEHWHYVRSSELRSIIPYINTTDYIVNTSMPYELALYRPRLLAQFSEWEQKYHEDPLRQDAYTRAERVHRLLQAVAPMESDQDVPADSVLREFIGGSIYPT
ncbi:MAG: response regulator SirA [Chloroflexi bacterium]|jgi:uridine kinase|nr:response regulator SirA [Chloroflexota bacterium]